MSKKDELIDAIQKEISEQLSWLTGYQLSGLTRNQLSWLTEDVLESIKERLESSRK